MTSTNGVMEVKVALTADETKLYELKSADWNTKRLKSDATLAHRCCFGYYAGKTIKFLRLDMVPCIRWFFIGQYEANFVEAAKILTDRITLVRDDKNSKLSAGEKKDLIEAVVKKFNDLLSRVEVTRAVCLKDTHLQLEQLLNPKAPQKQEEPASTSPESTSTEGGQKQAPVPVTTNAANSAPAPQNSVNTQPPIQPKPVVQQQPAPSTVRAEGQPQEEKTESKRSSGGANLPQPSPSKKFLGFIPVPTFPWGSSQPAQEAQPQIQLPPSVDEMKPLEKQTLRRSSRKSPSSDKKDSVVSSKQSSPQSAKGKTKSKKK
jgi:hypothetical protein